MKWARAIESRFRTRQFYVTKSSFIRICGFLFRCQLTKVHGWLREEYELHDCIYKGQSGPKSWKLALNRLTAANDKYWYDVVHEKGNEGLAEGLHLLVRILGPINSSPSRITRESRSYLGQSRNQPIKFLKESRPSDALIFTAAKRLTGQVQRLTRELSLNITSDKFKLLK